MTEKTKELINYIRVNLKHNKCFGGVNLDEEDCKLLLDYITNLQQDLDKANNIIEKDRQFYKCRMDKYAELKKKNEELNRMCELYSKSLYNAELTDYKSRCEKAVEYVKEHWVIDEPIKFKNDLLNILNGSDEK